MHHRRPSRAERILREHGRKLAVTVLSLSVLTGVGLHRGDVKATAQAAEPVQSFSVATPSWSATTSTTIAEQTTTTAAVPNNPFVVPAGGALPSPAECAKNVVKTNETRPGNAAMNHTTGKMNNATLGNWGRNSGANALMHRVDGKYAGTTDEIIQWASCKWGIDPDQVRAQAMVESSWHQTSVAGFVPDTGNCTDTSWRRVATSTSTSSTSTTSTTLADDTTSTTTTGTPQYECPTAFGLLQLRSDFQPGTYPLSAKSTAYNVDYALAMQRACIDGVSWLGAAAKGDVWGCVGAFYSGALHDAAANQYIARVQDALDHKTWR